MKTEKLKNRRSIFALAIVCLLALPSFVFGQNLMVPKGLALVNYGSVPSSKKEQLQVSVWMDKSQFVSGESIKFYVQGNQSFYLWLFSIDEQTGQADMIIPGQLQKGNKFTGNRRYSVPSYRNLIAGAPGNKKVVMVTSTKWLNSFDLNKLTVKDGYYSTSSQNMDVMLKGLSLTNNNSNNNSNINSNNNSNNNSRPTTVSNQVVVSKFNFQVLGNGAGQGNVVLGGSQQAPANAVAAENVVFVAQNRDSYNLGDQVSIVFGANRPGFVELFIQYPNGKTDFLKKSRVDGKQAYSVSAIAIPPAGPQTLMAVFHPSEGETFQTTRIQGFIDWVFKGNNQEKGLYITNPNQNVPQTQQTIYGMSRFHIR